MRSQTIFLFPLVLLAAAIIGCGGSSSGGSTTGGTTPNKVTVTMPAGSMFTPMDAAVNPGDTVEWVNNDTLPHTIKPDVATPSMDSDPTFPGGIANGQKFSWVVPVSATPGTKFFYHCKFHGTAGNGTAFGAGMVGVVTVQ
jgi:plastocyanin